MARSKVDDTATRVAVTTMTITLGEQRYTPIEYNAFSVGPFTATIEIQPDDDIEQRVEEAYEHLRSAARLAYKSALESYTKALSYNDKYVKKYMQEMRRSNGT